MRLLIIEDEEYISDSIINFFQSQNHICDAAFDIHSSIEKLNQTAYDCILLDLMLPDGNGLDILRKLRSGEKNNPVVIISVKDSLEDKVIGLDLGADDYISKPFHLAELNSRIAAVIRRRNFDGKQVLKFGELSIDASSKTVSFQKKTIELTRKEFELLLFFAGNEGSLISINAIATHLWGEAFQGVNDSVYTHVKNLKKKLSAASGSNHIRSVYGMGYKFLKP